MFEHVGDLGEVSGFAVLHSYEFVPKQNDTLTPSEGQFCFHCEF